jgi:hypothetical protein
MKARFIVLALLLVSIASASAAGAAYCNDIFGNTNSVVSSSIYSATTFYSLLSVSLLIVFAVLLVLALLYGIGAGFGISKLVTFVKSEYMESVFNILLIMLIWSGMASLNGVTNFFTGVATSTSSAQVQGPIGMQSLYTSLCTNIFNNQIIPAGKAFVSFTLLNMVYTFLSGTEIHVFISGTIASVIPSFMISPLQGIGFISNIIGLEKSASILMLAISITLIFLFFAIYFLFPVFLYLGILFRALPWTRAAGGTFLALFISFYIVFPALLYPIEAAPSALSSINTGAASSLPSIQQNTDIISYFQSTILPIYQSDTGISQIFSPLESNSSLYALEVSYFVMLLIGVFIAFLISFDLVSVLARVLGAPSLNAGRIMQAVL